VAYVQRGSNSVPFIVAVLSNPAILESRFILYDLVAQRLFCPPSVAIPGQVLSVAVVPLDHVGDHARFSIAFFSFTFDNLF
jgi:hypothetical protein